MDKSVLDKINKFTRRPLKENEVYVFSVILCDNEVDRDCERFSDEALEALKSSFTGKTGIFDHERLLSIRTPVYLIRSSSLTAPAPLPTAVHTNT